MRHHGALILAATLLPCLAFASTGDAHADPVAGLAISLALVLTGAKLGGHVAVRFGQPAVLGELVAGIVLGNLSHLGLDRLEYLKQDAFVDMLARLGVLMLLFEVGVESTVGQMMKVGLSSLFVASIGVVTPFALGWGAGAWLLPDRSVYVHAFLGATLTATSVGITARVLKDLGTIQTPEARVILGAAVIDDVFGLVILAAIAGIIGAAESGKPMSYGAIGLIVVKAAAFLIGSTVLGVRYSPRLFQMASKLHGNGVLLSTALSFCFLLCWIADAIGLAPVVGAFAAGLILEELHYRAFKDRGEQGLEELLHPISSFLVPIFFVLMGIRTDLALFAQPGVLSLAATMTAVAIAGKLISGLGVVGGGIDRVTVGIGMIPRGEVGLIFANMGLTLQVAGQRIVDPATFSAVVVMVVVTTLITPPLLQWRSRRAATT